MAIKHVVRCDGDECGREAPLKEGSTTHTLTSAGAFPASSYSVPPEWKQIDGRQFCSWKCLGQYAEAAQKQGKR